MNNHLKTACLFDIYSTNDNIVSLSVHLVYNNHAKSLKDETVNRYRDKLINDLRNNLNITVRGIHEHNTNQS